MVDPFVGYIYIRIILMYFLKLVNHYFLYILGNMRFFTNHQCILNLSIKVNANIHRILK